MISAITVGISNWHRYTLPLINSWKEHAPFPSEFILVDNGSKPPYEKVSGVRLQRIPVTVPYSAAINTGISIARNDWLLIINNDVMIEGKIKLPELTRAIYTKDVIEWEVDGGLVIPYPRGWCYLIHRSVVDEIGPWDESFEHAVTDDLDYGWRGWKLGIPTLKLDLPLSHLDQKAVGGSEARRAAKERNIRRFEQKHGFSNSTSGG